MVLYHTGPYLPRVMLVKARRKKGGHNIKLALDATLCIKYDTSSCFSLFFRDAFVSQRVDQNLN